VQRSSETIGTIAAALAKAQAQLINPEKSLTATIRSDGTGGSERSFRYAPLSTGLDIVRKTLSQHEIATLQTTQIDGSAGIVRLSTVLAHASGEWIASDWPVCAINETSMPHRMGAALTYARRYALFTLVGIAGEDDLDTPDLLSSTASKGKTGGAIGDKKDRLNGGQENAKAQQASASHPTKASQSTLEPEASAALREQLIAGTKDIGSADEAASWAHRVMGAKNSLVVADAEQVERAFQERLLSVTSEATAPSLPPKGAVLSSTKVYWRCRRCDVFATAITSNQLPNSRAWSVVGVLRMRSICALRNQRHWVARSVMSSLSRSVVGTIARCIAAVMKPSGGTTLGLIRLPPPESFG